MSRVSSVVVALWLLAALLAVRFALHVVEASQRSTNGFGAYYTASRLVLDGAEMARFYDDEAFAIHVRSFTGEEDIYNVNPPTAALLLLPLAWLPHHAARAVWNVVGAVLLVGLVLLAARPLAGHQVAAMVAFVAVFQPLWATFGNAQAYMPLLALLALVWLGEVHDRPLVTGFGLGLMLVLKTAGVLLPLWLLARRRFRALAWTALVGAVVVAASLPWLGVDSWSVYLRELPELRRQPWLSATAFQTHTSLIRHLLATGPQGSPIVDAPALAWSLETLVLLLSVGGCAWLGARSRDVAATFSCFVLANLMLSPVSVDYHYVLTLLPLWWLTRARPSRIELSLLVIGALLIAADLPYRGLRLQDGVLALLAYPKLLGAACLFIVAAMRSWTSCFPDQRPHSEVP